MDDLTDVNFQPEDGPISQTPAVVDHVALPKDDMKTKNDAVSPDDRERAQGCDKIRNNAGSQSDRKGSKNGVKAKVGSASGDDRKEVKDEPKHDGQTGENMTASPDLLREVLERLRTVEDQLREIKTKKESDESDSEILTKSEGDKVQKEQEEEEEEEEGQFDVDKGIKYLPSENWCLEKQRSLWDGDTSKYSLVISMKATHISSLHLSSESNQSPSSLEEEFPKKKNMVKDVSNRVPDRVALACPILLAEVGRISGTKLETAANVLVRPFKILTPFREEFVESLKMHEERYEALLSDQEVTRASLFDLVAENSEDAKKEKPNGRLESECTDEESQATERKKERKTTKKIIIGMKCLLHFIDKDIRDIMDIRHAIKERTLQEIAFEHLWHLFEPGDLIISAKPKAQAYRVLLAGGGRPHRDKVDKMGRPVINSGQKITSDFIIDCFYVDFNGSHYGPAPATFRISPYEGKRLITALDVVPFRFLPSEDSTLMADLAARGKKFMKLARVSHNRYKGLTLKEENFRLEEVDSDIIVDFVLAFKNSSPPYERELHPPALGEGIIEEPTPLSPEETLEVRQGCADFGCCEKRYVFNDADFDLSRRSEWISRSAKGLRLVPDEESLRDKNWQILLPYRVYGYVLLSRKWYPLDIDIVTDVKVEQKDVRDGFNDLVLPDEHKKIVRALVKTHARGPRSTGGTKPSNSVTSRDIDLVKGKGRGLIILLHGVPGVGKTSTAECVAASTNRPLFPITVGDIGGTTAKEVENNLESYFDLARKWGCVLLLDEADVFLGERRKGDIVQNSLVSVFLRVLEYYSGILILTTNRVGQFDEAIKSRIHISLYYPPLKRKTALKIWKMNLDRLERMRDNNTAARPLKFNSADIMAFAKKHWANNESNKSHWNGRQIKNAFQTAIALAEFEHLESTDADNDKEVPLTAWHFSQVAEASARFDDYLVSLRNLDSVNAKENKNRYDDYNMDRGERNQAGLYFPSYQETRVAQREKNAKQKQKQKLLDTRSMQSSDDSEMSSDDSDELVKARQREMAEEKQRASEQQRKAAKKEERKRLRKEAEELKELAELKKKEQKSAKIRKEESSSDSDSSDQF